MLVSLTVGKVDAGVTVLLTPDKRLIEFPSILLPPNISSGSIVDINVSQNTTKEATEQAAFRALQSRILASFGAAVPSAPILRCRNATQTSVVLEWDPIALATADLTSLTLHRNGQKAGAIPRPLHMRSTKISGLAVDTEYVFHLVLRTSAGTFQSDKVAVRTHRMTDLGGITITPGLMPAPTRDALARAVDRIGAKMADGVRIDTTHFVTTEGRGAAWELAVENNIPVVRPEWVDACEKNGRILGVTKFYLDAMRPAGPVGGETAATQAQAQAVNQAAPSASANEGSGQREEQRGDSNKSKDEDKEKKADEEEADAAAKEEKEKQGVTGEKGAEQPQQQELEAEKAPHSSQKEEQDETEDGKAGEQEVAMRPAEAAAEKNDSREDETEEKGVEEDEDERKSDAGKNEVEQDKNQGIQSPDGDSFQEVQL